MVEIGVKKGRYWPEETTNKGPTRINAGACALLKLIINKRHDSIETGHVLFMLRLLHIPRFKNINTPKVFTPSRWTMHKVINSAYSHISVPAQELHSRATLSVGGSITAQSVQLQGKILEDGRKKS